MHSNRRLGDIGFVSSVAEIDVVPVGRRHRDQDSRLVMLWLIVSTGAPVMSSTR
jgi:hypothetical protein